MTGENPLLAVDGLPAFERIRPEHVEPAVDLVLAANRKQVESIASMNDIDYPSFAGALEELADRLAKVWSPVSHLNSVCSSDAWRAAYNACLPKLTEYWTQMDQDPRLCAGYRTLSARMDLSDEERVVVDHSLRDFHLSGVDLPEVPRKRFGEINLQLSALASKFSENVLDATKAWRKPVTEADLKGLPEMAIEATREAAQMRGESGFLLTLDYPCYLAVMTYAESRELRREMYEAYVTRASAVGPNAGQFDNTPIIEEILALRREQAQLLGFPSYATYSLQTKMADTPERVLTFLYELADRSLPTARRDLEELQTFARDELGLSEVTSWDSMFASERLRRARYDVSKELLRPYFPIERVLKGLFDIASRLFEIDISEVNGLQRWHESVRCFEVSRSGSVLGQFSLDPFARENKRSGAWMDGCRSRRMRSDGLQLPVAYLVCNFAPPVGDRPALMTHDEVITLFHEFGHGFHHLLTRVVRAPVSGINGVPWDAVELPSQFLENWCWDREAIGAISSHWQTGEPLPAALLDRMLDAKNFQSAMFMVRQLEFGLFDMRIHHEGADGDTAFVRRVLGEVRQRVAVLQPPEVSRWENTFSHIFAGGYAAGYYSYKWAEVLSADAFAAFEEEGVFSRETGWRFRSAILERGGVVEPEAAFIAFRGRAPEQTALLRHAGIIK